MVRGFGNESCRQAVPLSSQDLSRFYRRILWLYVLPSIPTGQWSNEGKAVVRSVKLYFVSSSSQMLSWLSSKVQEPVQKLCVVVSKAESLSWVVKCFTVLKRVVSGYTSAQDAGVMMEAVGRTMQSRVNLEGQQDGVGRREGLASFTTWQVNSICIQLKGLVGATTRRERSREWRASKSKRL